MWRGVRSVWLPAGAGAAGLGSYWATHRRQSSSSCEESREPQGDEKGPGFLGVFLDTESVAKVLKLTTRSSPITLVPHAIIHLHPDPDTHHVFAPLCGAKAKLRVKGLAEDMSTKQRALVVDVRVGRGPVSAEGFVPVVAFGSDSWEDGVADQLASDLARRLKAAGALDSKSPKWEAELPALALDGMRYPATRASFTQINPPLMLEGTICPSSRYDVRSGECRPIGDEGEERDGEGPEVKGECPLCTYMLNGPCREVFIPFKACLDRSGNTDEQEDLRACEPLAAVLNDCIMKHRLFGDDGDEDDDEDHEADGASGDRKRTSGRNRR